MRDAPSEETPQGLGLGTFLGVYTPTVLTILGVILYLRMGWVVGQAGVGGAVLIVLIAHAITIITALSLSSLSTNMRVGVGGAYFIISRSLGLEMGGALGIPLYLSQTLSVTLYAFGLAESALFVFGATGVDPWVVQAIAAGIVVAVTALAARSTVFALKAQLPIMGFIAISLVCLVAGVDWGSTPAAPPTNFHAEPFWGVFAVFFPAVTGVMAGLGLSGDLREPGKSIPIGVLFAVGTGFVVYLAAPFVLSQAASFDELLNDKLIWTKVAVGGMLAILPGLFGAVLSSAIGSILGAPRTLQALAQDGLVPGRVGKLNNTTGEPMFALYLSGGVALAAVLLGDLNAVAEVVSMFFLTTYGMLNLAAALEAWVKDPSFRPRLRIPFWLSLLGAVGCFLAMALISPVAFVIAVVVELALWWWLSKRRLHAAWGDLRTGFWFAAMRLALMKLRTARFDPRNWRPHLLVFSGDLERDLPVVRMATNFGQDHGIVTVCTLIPGHLDDRSACLERRARHKQMLDAAGLIAFPEVHVVDTLEQGLLTTAQANGFAGVHSNMVALRWPRSVENLPRVIRWVRHFDSLGKSTMIMRPSSGKLAPATEREILVWWKGKESNGDLMLLLAHLLVLSPRWHGARIVLLSIVSNPAESRPLVDRVKASLADSNIALRVETIVRTGDDGVVDLIRDRSREADLVFLGMSLVELGQEEAGAARLEALAGDLDSLIFVRNSGPFRGRLV